MWCISGGLVSPNPTRLHYKQQQNEKEGYRKHTSVYIGIVLVEAAHIPPLKVWVVKVTFRVLALLLSCHGLMCTNGIYDEEK